MDLNSPFSWGSVWMIIAMHRRGLESAFLGTRSAACGGIGGWSDSRVPDGICTGTFLHSIYIYTCTVVYTCIFLYDK